MEDENKILLIMVVIGLFLVIWYVIDPTGGIYLDFSKFFTHK